MWQEVSAELVPLTCHCVFPPDRAQIWDQAIGREMGVDHPVSPPLPLTPEATGKPQRSVASRRVDRGALTRSPSYSPISCTQCMQSRDDCSRSAPVTYTMARSTN